MIPTKTDLKNLREDTDRLLQYFQEQDYDSQHACAVMGLAITSIIIDQNTAALFVETLCEAFALRSELDKEVSNVHH